MPGVPGLVEALESLTTSLVSLDERVAILEGRSSGVEAYSWRVQFATAAPPESWDGVVLDPPPPAGSFVGFLLGFVANSSGSPEPMGAQLRLVHDAGGQSTPLTSSGRTRGETDGIGGQKFALLSAGPVEVNEGDEVRLEGYAYASTRTYELDLVLIRTTLT